MAFEQAATVLRQRDRAFLFVQGHALDESLILEVSEIAGAVARIPKIALRDDPKRADGGERPRFGSVQRVVGVATVHQLAVVAMWQVEIANDYVSRIGSAIVMQVTNLAVMLAGLGVPAANLVVRILGEFAPDPSERQVLVFAIVNPIISLARIEIARIEIARHRAPPNVFADHQTWRKTFRLSEALGGAAIHDRTVSDDVGCRSVL